jgi:hypothetical protein
VANNELSFIIRAIDKTKEGLKNAADNVKNFADKAKKSSEGMLDSIKGYISSFSTIMQKILGGMAMALKAALIAIPIAAAVAFRSAIDYAKQMRDNANLEPEMRKNVDAINAFTSAWSSAISEMKKSFSEWTANAWGGFIRWSNIAWEHTKQTFKDWGSRLIGRGPIEKMSHEEIKESVDESLRDTERLVEPEAKARAEKAKADEERRQYERSRLKDEERIKLNQGEMQVQEEAKTRLAEQYKGSMVDGRITEESVKIAEAQAKVEKKLLELEKERDQIQDRINQKKEREAKLVEAFMEQEYQTRRAKEKQALSESEQGRMKKIQDAANQYSERASGQASMLREGASMMDAQAENFRARALDRGFRKSQDKAIKEQEKEEQRFQNLIAAGKRGIRSKDIREAMKADEARKMAESMRAEAEALDKKAKEAQIHAADLLEKIEDNLKKNLEML